MRVTVSLAERRCVRIMLEPMSEIDEGMFPQKSGMDKSVGYLIAGVVVMLVFLLIVLGMGRIQSLTDDVNMEPVNFSQEDKAPEIGGTQSATLKE